MDSRAEAVIGLFPKLEPAAQEIALQLYRLLLGGVPVRRERLATELNLPTRDVVRLLDAWPSHVAFDDWLSIVGFGGLSVVPTKHRFVVADVTLYTWCVWDALFIPELLNEPAEVFSACPETDTPISVSVAPSCAAVAIPDRTVVSFRVPGVHEVRQDVRTHFCRYVRFLSSPEAGGSWVERNGGFLLCLEEAVELGRRKNAAQFRGC